MKAAAQLFGFGLNLKELPWGRRYRKENGKVVPDDYLKILVL
jgi:hypothetical protein